MNFYKPFFKKTLYLNELLVKNHKLLKFKHEKWLRVILLFKQQLLENKLNKFKLIDQEKLILDSRSSKGSNYRQNYKFYFTCLKRLKCYYLFICRKALKKSTSLHSALNLLEKRTDVSLFKSKFCLTIREARQLVTNKCIHVNGKKINIKSYILSCGDIVRLKISCNRYRKSLINCFKWNIPAIPRIINYTAKEILIFSSFTSLLLNFPYYLYLNKLFITRNGHF